MPSVCYDKHCLLRADSHLQYNAATYHPARPPLPHNFETLRPTVCSTVPSQPLLHPPRHVGKLRQPATGLDCTALCIILSFLLSLSILLYTTLKWYGSCVHYTTDHMILPVEVGCVDALCLVCAEVFYSLLTLTSTTMAAIPSLHENTRW